MAFHPKNLIRVNNRIRVPEVRVIDAEGNQLGVLPTPKAMEVAQRSGLDLVEVAPTAKPPVCRICDFGKFRYEMSKKDKQNKAPASSRVKELKFHINIDEHDFEVKMNHARKFLSKGMRVKISLVFRGREMIHAERGAELIKQIQTNLGDVAHAEAAPRMIGRAIHLMMIASQGKARPDKPLAVEGLRINRGPPGGGHQHRPDASAPPPAASSSTPGAQPFGQSIQIKLPNSSATKK